MYIYDSQYICNSCGKYCHRTLKLYRISIKTDYADIDVLCAGLFGGDLVGVCFLESNAYADAVLILLAPDTEVVNDIRWDVPNDVIVEGSAEEKSMAQYSLNLPSQLKQDAQKWAENQGVSLDEFILWAVAEKVGALKEQLNEQTFPNIIYRCGASGQVLSVLRGTNLRVQTVVVASGQWGLSPNEIAAEYDLSEAHVNEALAFYAAHRSEIDAAIAAEQTLEAVNA